MIAYANQSTTGRKGCINPLKGFPGCAAAGTYPHAAGEKTPRRVRIHLPAKSSIFAPPRDRGVLDDGRLGRVRKLVWRAAESPPLRRDRRFEIHLPPAVSQERPVTCGETVRPLHALREP